jgi:hypothetical protein
MTTHKECTVTSNHTHHTTIPARQRRITAPGSLRMVARTTPFAAAIAVSALGSLSLGAGIAQADPIQVKPGLTCDRNAGLFVNTTCTNTTKTDYMVIETTECAGGDFYMPGSFQSGGPGGGSYSSGSFTYIDPAVKYDSIFVAANDVATVPTSSCDLDATHVSYTFGPPPPPDAPPPS